jgi:oxygen-dependent protoporphyrinogen oxidase
MSRVVIVGGGITGLAAAYYLAKGNADVTLIEERPRLGGVIETRVIEGCILDCGPDSFLSAKPWAMELINELGMADEAIGSNDRERVTYVLRGNALVALPEGLMMMVPTRMRPILETKLISWPTKLRMGLEYFRRPRRNTRDRSVSEFIGDHYGREAVDYLAEPLLAGVYGGDPGQLSAASVLGRFVELETKYGSVTRGVLTERPKTSGEPPPLFRTLRGGLGTLTGTLAARANPRVIHGHAEAIEPGRVRVNSTWMDADQIVLACPAWAAAALLNNVDAGLADLLGGIDYSSSMILALGYQASETGHLPKGFGFLIPRRERRDLAAVTFINTKFPHRASEQMVVLRCFFGGVGRETLLDLPGEAVVKIARDELRRILGLKAEPRFHAIARWPRSMAQYTVGHAERVRKIEERMASHPGIHLAGNAYHGIGIPDCIRMARDVAGKILKSALERVR